MTDKIKFSIDGKEYLAEPSESIWDVAKKNNIDIPHLCYSPEPGYRADGNCRACMVEIKGERTLAASCIRKPTEGMEVTVNSPRAEKSRSMVFELLVSDQPSKEQSPDPDSKFWNWSEKMGVSTSRFPGKEKINLDDALDVFAVHGVGGIIGILGTGIFADKSGAIGIIEGSSDLFIDNLVMIVATVGYSFLVTYVVLKVLDKIPGLGLRSSETDEDQGLDVSDHGETAYISDGADTA